MLGGFRVAAICVSGLQNEDMQSMLYPLYKCMKNGGWKTVYFNSHTDLWEQSPYNDGENCVFSLIDYDIADVVIIFARCIKNRRAIEKIIESAAGAGKTAVVIDPEEPFENCVSVRFDEMNAFRELVTHIVEEHKVTKIHCIAGIKGNPASEKRVNVLKDVLGEHGIPFEKERLGYGDFYSYPTEAVMHRFLRDKDNIPEAIICINDTMAITAFEILSSYGLSVPEDVIITGFDGIEQEKYCSPRLTTCRRDIDKLSELVCMIADKVSAGENVDSEYIFPYTLCISESCGCKALDKRKNVKYINTLYDRTNESYEYNRSMSNLLMQLKSDQSFDEIKGVLKYYIKFNTHLCLNKNFDMEYFEPSCTDRPFSDEIDASSFLYGEDSVLSRTISFDERLPEWNNLLERDEPLVFHVIHNQDRVYGYTAVYVMSYEFQYFALSCIKLYHFTETINNCMSMYVQNRHLSMTNKRLLDIQNKIIMSFADMVESRDNCTGQHIKRTSEYFRILVEHLAKDEKYASQLTKDAREMMSRAAALHDIGKIKVSDTILNKPGKLTEEEFELIKHHTVEGGAIIEKALTGIEDDVYVDMARDMAVYHHEKWDGSGYPHKLSGEVIPLAARIMAVVDVFDALTSKRVYKDAFPIEEAFYIVSVSAGNHFDPNIANAFIEISDQVEAVYRNNSDVV